MTNFKGDFDHTGDRLQRFTKLCVSAAVNNSFFCSKLKWRSLHRRALLGLFMAKIHKIDPDVLVVCLFATFFFFV